MNYLSKVSKDSKRIRIDQFSPIQIRNLYSQKRTNSLRYFLPIPSHHTQKMISEFGDKNPTYKVERSENRSSFIITVSWERDYGSNSRIAKTSNSYFLPISSREFGQLLPKGVKTCGIIIDPSEFRIIVPLSQFGKRELNTILLHEDIYNFNFKKNIIRGSFM